MKKIRCPKCENYLTFDETNYTEGQSLVFECEHCRKQFSIRIVKKTKESASEEKEPERNYGYITVIENVFGFKQIFSLKLGDNLIGRRCIGTVIDIPIESSDMSMDRRHCIINVTQTKKTGKLVYTLHDAPSLTGTFVENEILGDKEFRRIEDGAVVTIGATTFILHTADK